MVRQFQVDVKRQVFIIPKIYIDLLTQLRLMQVNNTSIYISDGHITNATCTNFSFHVVSIHYV